MASQADERMSESVNDDTYAAAEDLSHPFICGLCTEKFDKLQTFIYHFTSHGINCSKTMHICECLYAEELDSASKSEIDLYKCRVCKQKFPSICSLHSHILHCSSDGSYIYDNTRKMAYPLSLHCSHFETRNSDECERLEEELACTGKPDDALSRAEKVDFILRNACTMYSNNNKKKQSTENKKQKRRKKTPKRYDDFVCGINSSTFIKNETNYEDTVEIDMLENKSEQTIESQIDTKEIDELDKDHVVVKVEVEENQICDQNDPSPDNGAREYDESKDCLDSVGNNNEKLHDMYRNNDEEDELTDEYTVPDEKDIKEKVSAAKNSKTSKQQKGQKKTRGREKSACPQCGKCFLPYKLKHHMISHTDERPYKCDQCPKAYKYLQHLETHKPAHQAVKPFYCDKCGKGFLTITMLRHHYMMHHADSKPCVCTVCGAGFISNFKLKRHMMKHTGEKKTQCDLCGMGFRTHYNLSVHIQGVHNKELRYMCSVCGRSFMTKYQHKVHMMKHSGERPYKCILCKAEYIERKDLRRHIKKSHSLLIEGSASALAELMDGCVSDGLITSKIEGDLGTSNIQQTLSQVPKQEEVDTAAEFIRAESQGVYVYADTDLHQSSQYHPNMKTTGEFTSVKVLPANGYHMEFPPHDFSFHNSELDGVNQGNVTQGLPSTIQEYS